MGQVRCKILVRSVHGFAADIIFGLRWMFRAIHLLNQMALHAGYAVQRWLSGSRLSHEHLRLLGKLAHMRRVASEAERLILPT